MRGPCTCRSLSISTNCFCQAMFIMDPKVTGSWFDPIPQTSEICNSLSNLCQNLVVNFVAHEKVYLSRIICVFVNNKFIQVTSADWVFFFTVDLPLNILKIFGVGMCEVCIFIYFSVKSLPSSNVYCWFTSNRKNLRRRGWNQSRR